MTDVKSNIKSFEDKADDLRKRAAHTLESAAESIRTAGNESAGTIHNLTDEAGKKLDDTASYVRDTCINAKLFGGFRNSIRRNPLRALALAAGVGLVAGFTCRASR